MAAFIFVSGCQETLGPFLVILITADTEDVLLPGPCGAEHHLSHPVVLEGPQATLVAVYFEESCSGWRRLQRTPILTRQQGPEGDSGFWEF